MSELLSQPELQKSKPAVDRISVGNGAIYALYFPDIASAESLIKKFWLNYSKGEMASQFESGELKPAETEITYCGRTSPMHMMESEQKKYPGMVIKLLVSGNTGALMPKAEEVLEDILKEEELI